MGISKRDRFTGVVASRQQRPPAWALALACGCACKLLSKDQPIPPKIGAPTYCFKHARTTTILGREAA
jgi:hypothetical protein